MQKTKSNKVKNYIKTFDFSAPDWDELPNGFFSSDKSLLTREEQGLHSGIFYAWLIYRTDVLRKEILQEKLLQNRLFNNLFLTAKILAFIAIFILITGNLINYFLIEVYHTIL